MNILNLVFLFILGTVVGSFLNVCIHRLPRGESIIFPASHCPACKRQLGVFDLIPILGYLLLRGRCRYCRKPISFRYPVVEFLTGSFFVFSAGELTISPLFFIFAATFSCLLIVIFFIDLEHMVIPDAVSVGGIFCGLAYNYYKALILQPAGELNPFLAAVFGMFLGYSLLLLIGKAGKLLFKKEAMGEGDLYLGALLGAFLGWQGIFLAIFLAYLLAGIVSIILLFSRRLKLGDYVPFGPALAAGGMIVFFFGNELISWYLNVFVLA